MDSETHASVKRAAITLSVLPLGTFVIAFLCGWSLIGGDTLGGGLAAFWGLATLILGITSIVWGISIIPKDWRFAGLCIFSGSFYTLLTLLPAIGKAVMSSISQ